jgi:hypothetical protein
VKRKELFKTLQMEDIQNTKPARQLLIDMRVRWSYTYVMLDRAETLKKVKHMLQSIIATNSEIVC